MQFSQQTKPATFLKCLWFGFRRLSPENLAFQNQRLPANLWCELLQQRFCFILKMNIHALFP